MKRKQRFLGVDDGAFSKNDERVLLVGALLRGPSELEAVLSSWVVRDGSDSTEKIADMLLKSRKRGQVKAIILQGSTVAGFNLVNARRLYELTRTPVICVYRKKPDWKKVERALQKIGRKAPPEPELHAYSGGWFQAEGMAPDEARKIIESLCVNSSVPEPVRYAHVIASGITMGESTKRV